MGLDRYKWITKQTKIEHLLSNNQLEPRTVVTIALEDKETGLVVPHPITHFIKEKYEFKGKSLSSQLNPARQIVRFFNFINQQIILENPDFLPLQDKGIKGLTLIHGARYITYCTGEKCQYGYLRGHIERYLIHFYDYLSKMELLDKDIELDTYITLPKDRNSGLARIIVYEGIKKHIEKHFKNPNNSEIFLCSTLHRDNLSSKYVSEFFGLKDSLYVNRRKGRDREVHITKIPREQAMEYLTSMSDKLAVLYGYNPYNKHISDETKRRVLKEQK